MSERKIVAFVPAKGRSDRIGNKNLRILDGEHLFKRKLRQLLACPLIDEVCLDTESDELAALASDLPVRRLKRPERLATNAADGHEMFAWECAQVRADLYIQALCTAPFVDEKTLERALGALDAEPAADSLVAVLRETHYLWRGGRPAYGEGRIPNSVDLPASTIEAMSLYAVRRSGEAPPARRFGKAPVLFELTPEESVDLNWPADLELAESIAAGRRAKANLGLAALRTHLSTALLADLGAELGFDGAVDPRVAGPARVKFLGRAKTLQLDRLRPGEDPNGIYRALDSYEFMRPGDVIVVGTRLPSAAYFGELNANVAIRRGVVGAVIDGRTRDAAAVRRLGFPVFARGAACRDIRYEGTVRGMNRPVRLGGVHVENEDYVLADGDGVFVVPKARWTEVVRRAWEVIEKEWQVKKAVALGESMSEILEARGVF